MTSYHLTLASVLLHLVSPPSWPLTLIRARFSPSLCLFSLTISPSPLLKSLYFSPLCPLLFVSYPPEMVDVRQPQNLSSRLVRPAHSGRDWLTLMGDRWRGRDSPHTRETWVSPKWEIYKEDSSSHLVSCSGWKSYHPSTLICTFLLPREAPLGTGGGSSFLLTGVCIGESPTDDVQLAGS